MVLRILLRITRTRTSAIRPITIIDNITNKSNENPKLKLIAPALKLESYRNQMMVIGPILGGLGVTKMPL